MEKAKEIYLPRKGKCGDGLRFLDRE